MAIAPRLTSPLGNELSDVEEGSFEHLQIYRSESVSLDGLEDYICSATRSSKIEFVFMDVTELGEDYEAELMRTLSNLTKSDDGQLKICTEDNENTNVLPFNIIDNAIEIYQSTRNVIYFGAIKFASFRRSEVQLNNYVNEIINKLKNKPNKFGSRVIIVYKKDNYNEIMKIYDFVYNHIYLSPEIKNNLFISNINIVDYFNISDEVKAECIDELSEIADRYASVVCEATYRVLHRRFNNEDKNKFSSIKSGQIDRVHKILRRGIIVGGIRNNDRPWGFDKIVEETRQNLLSGFIRETIQPYRSSSNTPAENFVNLKIKPLFLRFSLPMKNLSYAAPAAFTAQKRQRQK